ncbi:MAG: AAA family ATPase [Candidatus Hydrogenedentes bacterium]|nr:AAA family ATPase [Candidatus Hydrogenedentota bacterium]
MRYTFFEFENFRGIEKLRLTLDSSPSNKIHTLVGLNESGKTTILEAINYFSYGAEDLDPLELTGYASPDIHDLIPIAKRANFNEKIVIRVGIILDDDDQSAVQSMLGREHKFRISNLSREIVVTEEYQFNSSKIEGDKTRLWQVAISGKRRGQRKNWRVPTTSLEWQAVVAFLRGRLPRIWYFPNFLFDFPDRIYLEDVPSHNDTTRKKHEFYRGVVQDILNSLENDTELDEHVVQRRKSTDPHDRTSLENLLLEIGRAVTDGVFNAWNEMFSHNIANKRIRVSVNQDDEDFVYMEFKLEDTDGYFSIAERSLGFRWFFVYLLITKYRGRRRGSSPNLLFLFDEPASNLHSSAQAQLLNSFEQLVETCDVIYTTHSHHLINPKWLENMFVVRNAGLEYDSTDAEYTASKTSITISRYREFASKHPDQSHYFQPVLDVLDYRPSDLENIPDVIMTEGKSDFYTLNYINDVVLETGNELKLMPGGGAGSLADVIRLYLGWGRNFIVLLDSDAEGTKQKERYKNLFGTLMDDKIFDYADIDELCSGKGLEALFADGELLKIQQAVNPDSSEYKKTEFSRAIQEAYINSIVVDLSQDTRKRFLAIFDFLQSKLDEVKGSYPEE